MSVPAKYKDILTPCEVELHCQYTENCEKASRKRRYIKVRQGYKMRYADRDIGISLNVNSDGYCATDLWTGQKINQFIDPCYMGVLIKRLLQDEDKYRQAFRDFPKDKMRKMRELFLDTKKNGIREL